MSIKKWCKDHDLTLYQFAAKMNRVDRTLYNWDNGTTSPTLDDIKDMTVIMQDHTGDVTQNAFDLFSK